MDNAEAAAHTADTKKGKKEKVRSAWISFAGRIVAQIVGAIATVALGVMVLHRYTSKDTRPPANALGTPPAAIAALPAQAPVHVLVLTPAMLGLHQAGDRLWLADRSCPPALDVPGTTVAHLDGDTVLSR